MQPKSATYPLGPEAAAALRDFFSEPERIDALVSREALLRALALARTIAGAPTAGLRLLGGPPVGERPVPVDAAPGSHRLTEHPDGAVALVCLRVPLATSGEGVGRPFGFLEVGPCRTAPDLDDLSRHVATVLVADAVARTAERDRLTGLLSRGVFDRSLPDLASQIAAGARATAMIFDVDGLRTVNAVHGYRCGDDVLRALAAAITAEAGPDGLAYRLGGDELLLVLSGATSDASLAVADRVAGVGDALPGHPTVSVGLAAAPDESAEPGVDDLVRRAEDALAHAKELGRGARVVWTPSDKARGRRADLAGVLTGDGARDRRLVTALLEAVADVASLRPLDETLREIVDRCIDVAGADRGFLLVREGDGLRVRVARGRGRSDLAPGDEGIAASVAQAALASSSTVHRTSADDETISPSAEELGVRSVLCAPLFGPDVPTGVVYVDSASTPSGFDAVTVSFFDALAAQALTALRNSVLYGRSVDRARELEGDVRGREEELVRVRQLWARDRATPREREVGYEAILGRSPAIVSLISTLKSLEGSAVPVVIEGESGTGKELVARAIHARSPRSAGPLIAVNCAAIPETLVESELFGHVKGSFTGATSDRDGLLAEADGGTLFLDELGELPLGAQAKLLRALQEGEVRPVGGSRSRRFDARLVAATNRDLRRLIADGAFREDLYYRLAVFRVELPPLRRRREDVPILVEAHLADLKHRGAVVGGITHAAMTALGRRAWRGNIRELRNEIERACALAGGAPIDVEHLAAEESAGVPAGLDVALFDLPMKTAKTLFAHAYAARAVERAGGSVADAASAVGVTRQTLYRVISEGERALDDVRSGKLPAGEGDEE